MTYKKRTLGLVISILSGLMLLFVTACANPTENAQIEDSPSVTSLKTEPLCAEGFKRLSASELAQLRKLQIEISYAVLVPACVPQDFVLNPETIMKTAPISSDGSTDGQSENLGKPRYEYSISNGLNKVDFAGNMTGEPSMARAEAKEVRGHNAYVYYGRRDDTSGRSVDELFAGSDYYRVLWDEGRDLPGRAGGVQGVYMVYAKQMKWSVLTIIINSMEPVEAI